MSVRDFVKRLRFFRPRGTRGGCRAAPLSGGWVEDRCGQRMWEDFYRERWQYDKKVRIPPTASTAPARVRGTFT